MPIEKISGKNTSRALLPACRVRWEEFLYIWKPKSSVWSESKPKRGSHIISDCGMMKNYVSIRNWSKYIQTYTIYITKKMKCVSFLMETLTVLLVFVEFSRWTGRCNFHCHHHSCSLVHLILCVYVFGCEIRAVVNLCQYCD